MTIEEEDALSFDIMLHCMYGEAVKDLIDLRPPKEKCLNSLLDILKLVDKYDVAGLDDEIAFLIFPTLDATHPTMKTAIATVYALSASRTEAVRRIIALTCHKSLDWILTEDKKLATLISESPGLPFALLENKKEFEDPPGMCISCPRCKNRKICGEVKLPKGRCPECHTIFSPAIFTAQLVLK